MKGPPDDVMGLTDGTIRHVLESVMRVQQQEIILNMHDRNISGGDNKYYIWNHWKSTMS